MNTKAFVLLTLFLVAFCLDAAACGDSLYRVGKGVAYRNYTAPLPGNVLIYGPSEGAKQLAEALAKSGHGVRLVANEIMLSTELSTGHYDVVIAPYDEHEAVESNNSGTTAYLPVAYSKEEAKVAQQEYQKVMQADRHEIKHYLKEIHKSLKNAQP